MLHYFSGDRLQIAAIFLLVGVAVFFDLRARRIPNWLIVAALMASLPFQAYFNSGWNWLGGLLAGFVLFIPGYICRQMGAGDVKLFAAVAAFFSAAAALKLALLAYVIGGVYAVLWMALQRDAGAWRQYIGLRLRIGLIALASRSGNPFAGAELLQARPRTAPMPYSVPIALASLCGLYLGW